MKNLLNNLTVMITLAFFSAVSVAHDGMHAAGQAHVGEYHMGLMEIVLSIIALLSVAAWALKTAKSKK